MFNNVKVTYQNCGSEWEIILAGYEEDIKRQFYSFWNHKGTSSRGLDWIDSNHATLWLAPRRNKEGVSLWNYFFNRRVHLLGDDFEELVKSRVKKYILKKNRSTGGKYRANLVGLYGRFERIYVGRIANKEFADFSGKCKTDFNRSRSLYIRGGVYNECMSQDDSEESFTPEVVEKCWTGE